MTDSPGQASTREGESQKIFDSRRCGRRSKKDAAEAVLDRMVQELVFDVKL